MGEWESWGGRDPPSTGPRGPAIVVVVTERESVSWKCVVRGVCGRVCRVAGTGGSDVVGTTESPKGTMVLQVLDLVSASNESFYGDCPVQTTYTNLDLNATGHTTCTVLPQGT